MDWGNFGGVLNLIALLIGGGGIVALFLANAQRKQIHSQTNSTDAEAALKRAQVEISLSTEARELLKVYSNDSKTAREEAAKARQEAAEADARARLAKGQLNFIVDYLRANGIDIPDYPNYLTEEIFDGRGY